MCEGNTANMIEGKPLADVKKYMHFKGCQKIKIWRSMVRHQMNDDDIRNGVNQEELLHELNLVFPDGKARDLWRKLQDKMRNNLRELKAREYVKEGAHGALIYSSRLHRWLRPDWNGDLDQLDPAPKNASSTAAELSPRTMTGKVYPPNQHPFASAKPAEPNTHPVSAPPASHWNTAPHNIIDLTRDRPAPSPQQQPQVSELQPDVQVMGTTSNHTEVDALMSEAPPLPPAFENNQPPQFMDAAWSPTATFDSSYARSTFSHPEALPAPLDINRSAQNVNPAMQQAQALQGLATYLHENPAALSSLGMTHEGLVAAFNCLGIGGSQPAFEPPQAPASQIAMTQQPQYHHPMVPVPVEQLPPQAPASQNPVTQHPQYPHPMVPVPVEQLNTTQPHVPAHSERTAAIQPGAPQPCTVGSAPPQVPPFSHTAVPQNPLPQTPVTQAPLTQTPVTQTPVTQAPLPQAPIPQNEMTGPATHVQNGQAQAAAPPLSTVAQREWAYVQMATPAPSAVGERETNARSFAVPSASSSSSDEQALPPHRPEYASEVGTLNPRAPPPPSSMLDTTSTYNPRLVVGGGNDTPALQAPRSARAGLSGADIRSWPDGCDRERGAQTPRPTVAPTTFAETALETVAHCLQQLERFENGSGTGQRDLNWQTCQRAVLRMLESL